jgi:ATP-binding cassette, subfamily B, bacterial MsbA
MDSLQRILNYTKKYWGRLLASIVTATFFGLFSAAPTYLLKHTVDNIFVKGCERLIIPCIIGFVVLFAFKGVFAYLSTYYMHWVGNRVVNDIRSDLFHKIIYFPLSFYKKRSTGVLMAHFLNDIAQIQNASSNAVKQGVRSFFEALALIGVAFFQNFKLAAMSLLVAPFIFIGIRLMGKAVKTASRAIQKEMGSMSSVLQEIFVGIREVKIFNAEEFEKNHFIKKLSCYFSSVMRNVKIEALGPAFMEAIAMFGAGFVFYIAAKQVLSGSITPGQLTSFFAASLLSYQPIKRLINVYAEVQYGLAAAERVFSLMDITYPALRDRVVVAKSFKREIVFKNLSFNYEDNKSVLKNVNLTIKKGERIGLLGPSGSGKSTFCDLLLGFINPTSGRILIDEKDIVNFSLNSLHNLVGSVSQQTFLFNDTVQKNVVYAQNNIAQEKVFDACRRAHASEFIENLSEKYQTIVGENGSRLSGGQKQRLTIARVLLKDPDILIFDEATSSLDVESEEMIRLALDDICKTKTVIVVSHRVSFVKKMDRVFTIQNGQFVELDKVRLQKTQLHTHEFKA